MGMQRMVLNGWGGHIRMANLDVGSSQRVAGIFLTE
jgi:hypothetical protein